MKNDIKYFYNLDPISIHQKDKKYYFTTENTNYLLEIIETEINEEHLYNLSSNLIYYNIPVHEFILNNNDKLISQIKNENYILLKLNIEKRKVYFNEIISFTNYYNNAKSNINWSDLWTNKIDNLEYLLNQKGKNYTLLTKSFSYYVGLSENAILLFNMIDKNNIKTSLTHKRLVYNSTTYDLYNPLNFIIDIYLRDICDYINSSFFNSEEAYNIVDNFLKNNYLNKEEKNIFFSRLLFPTYYFDTYEKIIYKDLNELEINKILKKTEQYEKFLIYIYNKLNLYNEMIEIEWIKKVTQY